MVRIKHIRIKNFRSIVNLDIDVSYISVFIGLNDVGKSNVLKALNLFFNGETEPGKKYNYDVDYSKVAPIKKKKASEVTIALTFEIPDHYKDNQDVTWEKIWRKETEPFYDNFDHLEFSAYSKVPMLLRRIRYKYVPAIKSDGYFKSLLADLYTSIANEMNAELVSKSKDYSSALTAFTEQIGSIVERNIGIQSKLRMPTNQIDIFKQLIFETSDNGNNTVELSYRGDGIKAIHIPAILYFIALQDNRALGANSVPPTTIWGYEEPENGIEMKKCFELADEIYRFSNDIQQFITTHSPGIYNLAEKEGVNAFYVSKSDNYSTLIVNEDKIENLNYQIGIIPIISPYIKQISEEAEKLKETIEKCQLLDVDTIFVEGITDKWYLGQAISSLSPFLNEKNSNNKLRITTRIENGCGTTVLCDWAKAWKYAGNSHKALFLFDNDSAGRKAYSDIKEFKSQERRHIDNIIPIKLQPSEDMKRLCSSINNCLIFEIEHLLSKAVWERLKKQKLLVERDSREIKRLFVNVGGIDESCEQLIVKYSENDYINSIIRYEPSGDNKDKIMKTVQQMIDEGEKDIFKYFYNTVEKIEATIR